MNSIQNIVLRRTELVAERKERTEQHEAFMRTTAAELAQLDETERLIVAGIDVDRIARARAIIDVFGKVTRAVPAADYLGAGPQQLAVRTACVADAKADLADGGEKIGCRYFGVKNYAGFGDQREDHEYGFGPRHGSIVFSVGLTRAIRERIRTGPHLEDHEIEDALYLLSALPQIEHAVVPRVAA